MTGYSKADPDSASCFGASEEREHRDKQTGPLAVADMSKDFLSYLADGRARLGDRRHGAEEVNVATRESQRHL